MLLLDTNALIFLVTGRKMRQAAVNTIDETLQRGTTFHLSPISSWELGLLAAAGKLNMPLPPLQWLNKSMNAAGLSFAPLTPEIMIASSFLPEGLPGDPADRIIAATARELGYTLITRDHALLRYAKAGHLQAIGC